MERLDLCVDPLPRKVLHLILLFIYHVEIAKFDLVSINN